MGVKLLGALCGNEDVQSFLETVTRMAMSGEAPHAWKSLRLPILMLYARIAELAARQPLHPVSLMASLLLGLALYFLPKGLFMSFRES
jgi:hypothetical protein